MSCANSTRMVEQHTGIALHPAVQEVTSADVIRDVVNGKVDAGLVFAPRR